MVEVCRRRDHLRSSIHRRRSNSTRLTQGESPTRHVPFHGIRVQLLLRIHIRHVDNVRRLVHHHQAEVSLVAQRPRLLQTNRLDPVGCLDVEDVQVRVGEDEEEVVVAVRCWEVKEMSGNSEEIEGKLREIFKTTH
jgi:hypothetical protein